MKPCQRMAYAEGEDIHSEPSIGSLRVPNRSLLLVIRPANIKDLVVVDRFLQ